MDAKEYIDNLKNTNTPGSYRKTFKIIDGAPAINFSTAGSISFKPPINKNTNVSTSIGNAKDETGVIGFKLDEDKRNLHSALNLFLDEYINNTFATIIDNHLKNPAQRAYINDNASAMYWDPIKEGLITAAQSGFFKFDQSLIQELTINFYITFAIYGDKDQPKEDFYDSDKWMIKDATGACIAVYFSELVLGNTNPTKAIMLPKCSIIEDKEGLFTFKK